MNRRVFWIQRLLLLIALVALMAAQYGALYDRNQVSTILLAYVVGLMGLWWLFRFLPATPPVPYVLQERVYPSDESGTRRFNPLWVRICLLLLSFALAIQAWMALTGNRFTLLGVSCWIGSTLAFLAAFWQPRFSFAYILAAYLSKDRSSISSLSRAFRSWVRKILAHEWRAALWQRFGNRQTVALLFLLGLALFTRLYRLESVPPEMNSDHVEKLLDVNDVLEGRYYIFFERNTGREPMQFYLVAAIIKLFDTGLSFYSLKLSNVVMAFLSVIGTYLLGREIGGHRLGWVAGFFVAVVLWAVAPSRVGLRYPFTPAFTSFSLWLLWRALRTNHRNDWLMAGLLLGAGLHGYTAFRIMPLAATATILLKIILERPTWRKLWLYTQNFVLYVSVSCFIFLPLARYMYEVPQMFWYRALTRSTSLEAEISEPLWILGAETFWRTLSMFNWYGDPVFVSIIPNLPVLNPVTSSLFICGLGYTLFVLTRQRPFMGLALLLNGLMLLTPSMLNFAFPGESPSVVRTGGAIPVIALIFALGVRYVYQCLQKGCSNPWAPLANRALVGLLLIAIAIINYNRYFDTYLTSYRLSSMNTAEVAATMTDYLSIVGDTKHMFIKGWAHWLDSRAIGIQLNDVDWGSTNTSMEIASLIEMAPQDDDPLLYILHPLDSESLDLLETRYPAGYSIIYRSPTPGRDYVFFFVPANRTVTYPSPYEQ